MTRIKSILSRRSILASALFMGLVPTAGFGADKPKTINIDWATYNPVSMVLKDKGLLEKEFAKDGIAIRAGHMCCQPLLRRYGQNALSRASLYFYNTREEIEDVLSVVQPSAQAKDLLLAFVTEAATPTTQTADATMTTTAAGCASPAALIEASAPRLAPINTTRRAPCRRAKATAARKSSAALSRRLSCILVSVTQ